MFYFSHLLHSVESVYGLRGEFQPGELIDSMRAFACNRGLVRAKVRIYGFSLLLSKYIQKCGAIFASGCVFCNSVDGILLPCKRL